MSETLGKIKKPEASQFKNGRKLFFVPLIFKSMEEDTALSELAARYWGEVENQIAGLETKLSEVKRIYHELLTDDEDIKHLGDLSSGSHKLVESLKNKGAVLTCIEDPVILGEFLDWGRCIAIGLRSPVVFETVYKSYEEAEHKRLEYLSKKIDETLEEDESSVLFMREDHSIQFPADIQVFYVAPPSFDAIQRVLREKREERLRRSGHDHGNGQDRSGETEKS
jgi:hypothetical protein